MQSYRDQLDFGLIAGANVMPDVDKLARLFPEEFEALEAAFGLEPPKTAELIAPPTPAPKKTPRAKTKA